MTAIRKKVKTLEWNQLNLTSLSACNTTICIAYIFANNKPTLGSAAVKASAYD